MKTLKFVSYLADMITRGEKTTTWRFFDDKEILESDDFVFINKETGKEFAKVIITSVKEKAFADLNEEDKNGHERFKNEEEMYAMYRRYYGDKIFPDTNVKIVKFKLTKLI
ncbi:MAG: ASCH domain-containing protein [Patescibacteria group bacterium]